MHDDFEEDVFLGPETTVSLHFESSRAENDDGWDIAAAEALERTEHSAWARHPIRANGVSGASGRFDADDEDDSRDLGEPLWHILTRRWI